MKNMKIEINAEQPLDEVVKHLKEKGYKTTFQLTKKPTWITMNTFGSLGYFSFKPSDDVFQTATLQQLREMES